MKIQKGALHPKAMRVNKKSLSVILACSGIVLLIIAGVVAFKQFLDDRYFQNTLNELRKNAEIRETVSPTLQPAATPAPEPAKTTEPTSTPEPTASPEPTPVLVVNPYLDSFLANADMAAWLQIPDTIIDYPVMWTPRDEEYYLRRGFDGRNNQNGCLILDTDSCLEPLTTNLIIHGHNMRVGTMFGTLDNYEDEDFYQNHKNIILYTKQCQRNYEVIAVFRSQVYKKSDTVFKFYKFFQADTKEEFDDFYDNIKAMSLYDTGVTAEFGDCFLTLSTCSYHVDYGRFVVVAKEVESGNYYLPIEEEQNSIME